MLLTISTSHRPATDLGFQLRKHPDRVHDVDTGFGVGRVFYTEATDERCTAVLALEIDAIGLVREKKRGLFDYVNDRPYAASSFLSVALGRAFRQTMSGTCPGRPELVDLPLPLEIGLPVLRAPDDDFVRSLFEPLGYEVHIERTSLDERFADWGPSPYVRLGLRCTMPLRDVLNHLYVLVPALDAEKHYFIGSAEVDKLLAAGKGWLGEHPARERIANRYLKRRGNLTREALALLSAADASDSDPDATEVAHGDGESALERPVRLQDLRMTAVVEALAATGAQRILDLGCGEGTLTRLMLHDRRFVHVTGLDVSARSLQIARERAHVATLSERESARITFLHGSLTYRDERLQGFDAAALVEVIEHLDASRLDALERVVFGDARPATVIVTTPNREYNVLFATLPAGAMRHADHRFEWTRREFAAWAGGIGERFGYAATFHEIGPHDDAAGAPTQMAVMTR